MFCKRTLSWLCQCYGEEELCEKGMEVRSVCDRVMVVVLVFDEDVLRLTAGYAL